MQGRSTAGVQNRTQLTLCLHVQMCVRSAGFLQGDFKGKFRTGRDCFSRTWAALLPPQLPRPRHRR